MSFLKVLKQYYNLEQNSQEFQACSLTVLLLNLENF